MSIRPLPSVTVHRNASPTVADEVRCLRRLADDCRAASFALFLKSNKPLASPGTHSSRLETAGRNAPSETGISGARVPR